MERLVGASSLVRALLILGRARGDGVLEVDASGRRGLIFHRANGRVEAVTITPDDEDPLGRALGLSRGVYAPGRRPGETVGRWAVRVGLATEDEVSRAAVAQAARRLWRLLQGAPRDMRFRGRVAVTDPPVMEEPPDAAVLILDALRRSERHADEQSLRGRLGGGRFQLTALGQDLLDRGALHPAERVLAGLLRSGTTAQSAFRSTGGSVRALRMMAALRRVGAAEARSPMPRPGYSTLLRKHREVGRRARPHELLGVSAGARPTETRQALRTLARSCHPDRFEASPAIQAVSQRVMGALLEAKGQLDAE